MAGRAANTKAHVRQRLCRSLGVGQAVLAGSHWFGGQENLSIGGSPGEPQDDVGVPRLLAELPIGRGTDAHPPAPRGEALTVDVRMCRSREN